MFLYTNSTVMGDLKGAPAVHFNFPIERFSTVGLPLPVRLFLQIMGDLVNGRSCSLVTIQINFTAEYYTLLY